MADKRIIRVRPSSGGVSGVLARRTGRAVEAPTSPIVRMDLPADVTPAVALLKAAGPSVRQSRATVPLHVSDLIGKCVRQLALTAKLRMPRPYGKLWDGTGITYAIGEALHRFVVGRMIAAHPEKVWARWTCACGRKEFVGLREQVNEKIICTHCNTAMVHHSEISYTNAAGTLRGSPDLLLFLDEEQALLPVEIKSMAAGQWNDLVRYVPDHAVQIALYWHLLVELGVRVVDKCSILYVNKEFSFKNPYKEFVIDPRQIDVSYYMSDLELCIEAMNGGPLPPRVLCASSQSAMAKECSVCATCFGLPE